MYIVGLVIGVMSIIGLCFVLMCCLIVGKREDEWMQAHFEERKVKLPKAEVRCQICFTDKNGRELFKIADGEAIHMVDNSGENNICFCYYVDSNHAVIDGIKWELRQFAEQMARNGISFMPLRNKEK